MSLQWIPYREQQWYAFERDKTSTAKALGNEGCFYSLNKL